MAALRLVSEKRESEMEIGNLEKLAVKPEPMRATMSIYSGASRGWSWWREEDDTHKITFNIIDCEPDPSNIKMEKL